MIWNPPPWDSELSYLEGEIIQVTGQVYRKEYKEKYNEQVMVFYLKTCDVKGPGQDEFQCDNFICEVPYAGVSADAVWLAQGKDGDEDTTGETCLFDRVRIGTVIRICGPLTLYSHATNPGEFDAADYYSVAQIAGRITEGEVLAIGKKYSPVQDGLQRLGDYLEASLLRSLGGEEAQLMAKMLLGRGEELSTDTKALYQEGGIYHILSISGMHISLLGMGVYRFLRKRSVPLSVAAAIGSVFIIAYGVMIGFGVSAVRAIGMYLVHLLGDVTGRSYDMPTAMGVMALGMALHNPKVLFSTGYLLSFACVFCLGFFTPALVGVVCGKEDFVGRREKPKEIGIYLLSLLCRRENLRGLTTSLSISIFTLPLQLYFFYQVPLYSVFLNLLVVPFVEVLMLLGILLLLFPFMAPFAWGIRGILRLYEWLCVLFLKLPGSVFIAGQPKAWAMVLFYVCIAIFIGCARRRRGAAGWPRPQLRRKAIRHVSVYRKAQGKVWPLVLGWVALLVGIALVCVPQRLQTRITFLDVGQGDCTLVQTLDGRNFLIDSGSSNRSSVGAYQIVPALKSLGVNYLDAIVLTHPDYDHYSALGDVLAVYGDRCGGIVLPAIDRQMRKEEFAVIYEEISGISDTREDAAVAARGEELAEMESMAATCLPIYFMGAGDVLYENKGIPLLRTLFPWAKGVRLSCLAPAREASYGGSNEYSIVLLLEYGRFSALFTGDVEGDGEEALCEVLEERLSQAEALAWQEEDVAGAVSVAPGTKEARLTVLKVAHHGSSGSTSKEFLALTRPRLAVISCGRNNRYGHPHAETLSRLAAAGSATLTTPDCGAITLEVGATGRVSIRRWGAQ